MYFHLSSKHFFKQRVKSQDHLPSSYITALQGLGFNRYELFFGFVEFFSDPLVRRIEQRGFDNRTVN